MATKKRTTKKHPKPSRVKPRTKSGAFLVRGKHTRKRKRDKKKKKVFKKKFKAPKKFKKLKKKKTAPSEEVIKDPDLREIWDLVTKGRNRGFITQTEAEMVFPRPEGYLDWYEGFMD